MLNLPDFFYHIEQTWFLFQYSVSEALFRFSDTRPESGYENQEYQGDLKSIVKERDSRELDPVRISSEEVKQ